MNFDVGEVLSWEIAYLFIYAFSVPLPPVMAWVYGITITLMKAAYVRSYRRLTRGAKPQPALQMAPT